MKNVRVNTIMNLVDDEMQLLRFLVEEVSTLNNSVYTQIQLGRVKQMQNILKNVFGKYTDVTGHLQELNEIENRLAEREKHEN